MAEVVMKGAEHFNAQAEVQRETGTGLPVILKEKRKIIGAVFVIGDTASPETEWRRTLKELLEVGKRAPVRKTGKDELPVKDLGEDLVEIDVSDVTSKPQDVGAFHPAHVFHEIQVVLGLELIGEGTGTDLETRTIQRVLVDRLGNAVGGTVDTEVRSRNRINVLEA